MKTEKSWKDKWVIFQIGIITIAVIIGVSSL